MEGNPLVHGQGLTKIVWPCNDLEMRRELTAGKDGVELYYMEQYMGDHSIGYVVEKVNGVVEAWHNIRMLESIYQ